MAIVKFKPQVLRDLLTLGLWEQAEFYVIGTIDGISMELEKSDDKAVAYFLENGKYLGLEYTVIG